MSCFPSLLSHKLVRFLLDLFGRWFLFLFLLDRLHWFWFPRFRGFSLLRFLSFLHFFFLDCMSFLFSFFLSASLLLNLWTIKCKGNFLRFLLGFVLFTGRFLYLLSLLLSRLFPFILHHRYSSWLWSLLFFFLMVLLLNWALFLFLLNLLLWFWNLFLLFNLLFRFVSFILHFNILLEILELANRNLRISLWSFLNRLRFILFRFCLFRFCLLLFKLLTYYL